ncbi:putative E3 ubiquitin-protein ligase HECTD2 [Tachypleus tridentatus]|uniref:putative E3 ubiquitin-protein ligase HECTD2 n=1 Tax=Tachypleus tridentatus TaxID=6853 RepID=UPI003FD59C8D
MDVAEERSLSAVSSVTCPSCKISVVPSSRSRTMCPFCGSFYNQAANNNLALRQRHDRSEETVHFPNIESHRPYMQFAGFGPLLTEGLGVIHTYITGLLLPPTSPNSNSALYLSLPPIQQTTEGRLVSIPGNSQDSDVRNNNQAFSSARSRGKSSISQKINFDDDVIVYPNRQYTVDFFRDEIEEAKSSGEFTKVQEIYETTFSSLVELNAVFKERPQEEVVKADNPEIKVDLLNAVYDNLTYLVSKISLQNLNLPQAFIDQQVILYLLKSTHIRKKVEKSKMPLVVALHHHKLYHQEAKQFSYCQYPFILSIVAKKTILQRDSEQQMILNARRSLLSRTLLQQAADIDVFFLNLNVRRSHLVSDSLNEVARKQSDLKKKLKVTFVGEPGLDMGGLTKEWFLLLIKQIFDIDYGMFVYHKKARCYWFSTAQMGNLREYNLIGVLMGLAVYNSTILDLHFPTACYKKLLSPPVVPKDLNHAEVGLCNFSMDDFAEVMPDVAIGLKELLAYEGNVEEDFCMNFQVSVEEFGEVKTHVLKPDGENIPVTNENREEYVQLYKDLILNKAIYKPFKAFYLGFHSVCASNALIMLRPEEVEMLVCGSPTLDMEELRKVTEYDGFQEDEPIIKEFWEVVKDYNQDLQKQFLRFTTGSDRVPVGGMGEMSFKISALNHNTEMLPISHTCFNQLVLPRYKSKDILKEKLTIAISNAEGFGLE